jgi:hypothetical protein
VKVLSYVNIGDLMRCGKVSKRFGKIRYTESLWRNVDLSYRSDAFDEKNVQSCQSQFHQGNLLCGTYCQLVGCRLLSKVSFFVQCTKMQLITLQTFNIQTYFSQFLWFFSL